MIYSLMFNTQIETCQRSFTHQKYESAFAVYNMYSSNLKINVPFFWHNGTSASLSCSRTYRLPIISRTVMAPLQHYNNTLPPQTRPLLAECSQFPRSNLVSSPLMVKMSHENSLCFFTGQSLDISSQILGRSTTL